MSYQKILAEEKRDVRAIYVSSYIPRQCGIATFTKDLTNAINELNPESLAEIIAVDDPFYKNYDYPWEVKYRIKQNDFSTYTAAADYINQSSAEIVHIQHEFGLYGGEMGEYIIPFINCIQKPVIVTFHTVLKDPPPKAKEIVRKIAGLCKAVIVISNKAAERLKNNHKPVGKIVVIPHGVPDFPKTEPDIYKTRLGFKGKRILCTHGLLNSDKGIEYVIKAMPRIIKKFPNTIYLVVGRTHPIVKKHEGEKYRNMLVALSKKLGVKNHVIFRNRYMTLERIIEYIQATDIYFTLHLKKEQISSGSLAYAVGAGKVCISTPFIYAKEVLGRGRGIFVPMRNSQKVAENVIDLFANPDKAEKYRSKAYDYGRKMIWSNVALKHLDLFSLIKGQTKKKK